MYVIFLTSFFPGSSKRFLIKTVDKIGRDWKIEDKRGSDYSGGGGSSMGNGNSDNVGSSGGGSSMGHGYSDNAAGGGGSM